MRFFSAVRAPEPKRVWHRRWKAVIWTEDDAHELGVPVPDWPYPTRSWATEEEALDVARAAVRAADDGWVWVGSVYIRESDIKKWGAAEFSYSTVDESCSS